MGRPFSWAISTIETFECNHRGDTRMSCLMMQDLVSLMKEVEREFQGSSELMRELKPTMTLVGSAAEGTRVGIGNELDITLSFNHWKERPIFRVGEDPFHLLATDNVAGHMMSYVDEERRLRFDRFMRHILEKVESSVSAVFDRRRNPEKLVRVTTNEAFDSDHLACKECRAARNAAETDGTPCKQCTRCVVTVSQTKIGVCLQFHWRRDDGQPVYCSIDLITSFNIEAVDDIRVARIVNGEMLGPWHPEEWLKYMVEYSEGIKTVKDGNERDEDEDTSLVMISLKMLHYGRKEKYYFVRPGEKWNSGETFQTDRLREVYCHIKILKKILGLDYIKSYMVKKLLSKPFYADLERQSVKWHTAVLTLLFKIFSLPEFKTKFCQDIDYERWIQLKPRKIPLLSKFDQLCKASADNKPEEFQKLLDGGATWTDQPLERGKNVLMFLMERNQIDMAEMCLAKLGNNKQEFVNWKSEYGETPLSFAITGDHIESVRWLLKHGADLKKTLEVEVTERNSGRNWPTFVIERRQIEKMLATARRNGNTAILEILREYGADIDCDQGCDSSS